MNTSEYIINLSLYDERNISKIIKIKTCNYEDLIKIASNKFNKKIQTIINNNDEKYDPSMLQNGLTLLCSTKILETKNFIENKINDPEIKINDPEIKICAINSYISDDAIRQLKALKKLNDVTHIFGMPDLHAGPGCPIGAVTITKNIIYPHLIGEDIGCGMSLIKTDMEADDYNQKKLLRLSQELNINGPYNDKKIDSKEWGGYFVPSILNNTNEKIKKLSDEFNDQMGTIGLGNHFCEIVKIIESNNELIDCKYLYVVVHSGSRGLGERILNMYQNNEITIDEYKELHNYALIWARHNRMNIADRLLKQTKCKEYFCIADMFHNFYEEINNCIVHRKGAAPCYDNKLIVIPGSRGNKTYVVVPEKSNINNGFSVSHGAGRKISRNKMYETRHDSKNNGTFDSIVICDDIKLKYEEEPRAYKNIEIVIDDLLKLDLIKIVASMEPLITYKMKNTH